MKAEALASAEARLAGLLTALAAGVLEADRDGRFTYANPAALRILGVAEAAVVGRTAAELGIRGQEDSGAPSASELPRGVGQGSGFGRGVSRCVRPGLPDVWIDVQEAALRSPAGEISGSVVSFIDVSERVRREVAERRGAGRMSEVLRSIAAGVVLVDAEGRIEYANAAAAAAAGLKPDDVVGQLVADPAWQLTDETGKILAYDALPVPTALRERREVRDVELGVPSTVGIVAWLRVNVFPLLDPDGSLRGAVVTTENVTEQHALAEHLLQAQKMEGIGQLAGGIAHDFNNLLTIILGNAELALSGLGPEASAAEDIAEIRDAANRGATLTRQLLTFARKQRVEPRVVQLDVLTEAVEKLLLRALGEDVVLRRSADPELWAVKIDPGQMEQVLVNMAVNARDAMPRGGSLSIELRNHLLGAAQAERHPGISAGDFVELSIRDAGCGMAPELIERIFEPFFTTKPLGDGSGLGLSICHGIIRQARGFISVESEPGRGTTFRICLPRTLEAPAAGEPPIESALSRGKGTILLVEDEAAVRSYVARVLSQYGYEVLSAGTGKQAMLLLERLTQPLDLVVTDVVMPEMGGVELARALLAQRPGLPVLFITGHFDERHREGQSLPVEAEVLLKPFTPMQLVRRVQRILSEAPRVGGGAGRG